MNITRLSSAMAAILAAVFVAQMLNAGQSTHHDAITYQGQLTLNGEPISGPVDLTFRLHNAAEYGDPVSPVLHATAFDQFDALGRFTIDLEFGTSVFDGTPRWLEITVDGTTLTPRQPIMPVPYSVRALNVSSVSDGALGGTYSNQVNLSNENNVINGSFIGSGSGLMNLNANRISHGTLGSGRLGGTYSQTLNFTNPTNTFAGNGFALKFLNAANLIGTLPDATLGGEYTNAVEFSNHENLFAGTFAGAFFGMGAGSFISMLTTSRLVN